MNALETRIQELATTIKTELDCGRNTEAGYLRLLAQVVGIDSGEWIKLTQSLITDEAIKRWLDGIVRAWVLVGFDKNAQGNAQKNFKSNTPARLKGALAHFGLTVKVSTIYRTPDKKSTVAPKFDPQHNVDGYMLGLKIERVIKSADVLTDERDIEYETVLKQQRLEHEDRTEQAKKDSEIKEQAQKLAVVMSEKVAEQRDSLQVHLDSAGAEIERLTAVIRRLEATITERDRTIVDLEHKVRALESEEKPTTPATPVRRQRTK